MKTYFDCIPCFVRQVLEAVRMITDDPDIIEQVMRQGLTIAGNMDLRQSPPAMAQKIHGVIRELTGSRDPYKEIKDRFNKFSAAMMPKLEKLVDESKDPFQTAVRLAIAGNIIDFGVTSSLELAHVEATIEDSLNAPLDMQALAKFKKAIGECNNILYLADNAGEIFFDKLLLERLPVSDVTVAVKGAPIINDGTMEDARAAGLTELFEVIDNGYDAPGTILEHCSEQFRERFARADLVISKGQGNYETLSDIDKNIFFILKAKCSVIALHLQCQVGSMIIAPNQIDKLEKS